MSTLELDELAETLIRAEGGIPAFKGYGGFPGSICASVNEQIVHGIPSAGVVLQEGDIITKFDGQKVESASDLMLDVRSKNPGDKVKLEVNRNGETKEVEVTLGSDESSQSASTQQNSAQESLLERLLGGGSGSSENAA